jgi:hypothetical protein
MKNEMTQDIDKLEQFAREPDTVLLDRHVPALKAEILSLISQVREAREAQGVLEELRTAAERDYGSPQITLRLAQAILAADLALHGKAPSYRTRALEAEAALATLKREVVDGLKLAEGWFRDYERQHRAKGTSEGNLKADTNEERAEFLALLSGRVGGSDSTDIAASVASDLTAGETQRKSEGDR